MPKVQTITTNFTAGEASPRLRGRVDLEKYNSSAEELRNCVVFRHGGATIRPPTKFMGEVKTSVRETRLLPFVYSRTDSYVLEMGHFYMRVWKDGERIETSPGVAYEIATIYSEADLGAIDYSQGADTMLLAHPDHPVQALQRFSDSRWVMRNAPFDPAPVAEMGDRSSATMTIDNVATGAGRAITASANFFLAADVGREITWGGGRATITSIGGPQSATATVTSAFGSTTANGTGGAAPVWLLEGSPRTACSPSAATPLGGACTLTLAADGWHGDDILDSLVEINGGLVKVTNYTGSAQVVDGVILRELSGTTAAPLDAWTQKKPMWNATDGYPAAVGFHQQRTWLANTARFPQTLVGSRSGLYFDFTPGVDDDAAVYKTVDSDEANPIQFIHSAKALAVLTLGSFFDVRGGVEKPITQTNTNISPQMRWGCAQVRPEQVGEHLLFVQRGGRAIRYVTPAEVEGFLSRDISVFSEHLMRQGLRWMSYEQNPESIVWAGTGDGKLVAITYDPEQNTNTFCSGDVSGFIEWGVTVPEGDTDATYLVVRREVAGLLKRYIERIDWGDWIDTQEMRNAHDCRKEWNGAASTVWDGFGHLSSLTVSVLADDVYIGDFVVDGDTIHGPRPARNVSVGIPYTARVRQQPPEVGTSSGTSQGQATSVHRVAVRLYKTIGIKINGQEVPFRNFDAPGTLDAAVQPYSGIKEVTTMGWNPGEAPLVLEQTQPYPWTVLAIIRNMTVNAS